MTWWAVVEIVVAGMCFLFALLPALQYARNVRLFRPPSAPAGALPPISVLIPARNEAGSIEAAVEAALASRGVEFEIVVLDDHSEDDTAAIVQRIAQRNSRVRLESAPPLPAGWCGKQHACFVLARLARYPVLCFVDADVRLDPSGLACMGGFLQSSGADLISGFPRQQTETFWEKLLVPLIHFLLLGFLPLTSMRRNRRPAYAAGCGQLFLSKREAYEKCGGHELVKASLHDGVTLPRAFRRHGLATDLCDATYAANCRMYRSGRDVWQGLGKNAREGLAAPRLIVPATLLLLFGQALPAPLLVYFLSRFAVLVQTPWAGFDTLMAAYQQSGLGVGLALSALATALMYYPRVDAALRFRQPMESALLHPLGIVALLVIQWWAAIRALLGRPDAWKGRDYPARRPIDGG
jgi:hypothetical protein